MAKKTIKGEIFGDSAQALFSKKGMPYVRATIVEKDDEGNINKFVGACFFPDESDVQKLRNYLCKGREVEVTGEYSEREYEGRDGNMKTAYDILVHSVKLGSVVEYDGEMKKTDFSFIKDSDKKAADTDLLKTAKKAAAKKSAAPKTKVQEPEDDDFDVSELDL